ncbi:MAG: hypothetical protein ACOYL0_16595, partial [Limnohabitans sp.]
ELGTSSGSGTVTAIAVLAGPLSLRNTNYGVWQQYSVSGSTSSNTGNLVIIFYWAGNPGSPAMNIDFDDVTITKENFFAELNDAGLQVYNSASNYIKIGKGAAVFNLDNTQFNNITINGAFTANGNIDFWGTPVYHNGYTVTGSTLSVAAIEVLNSLTTLSTTVNTSFYGLEIDNSAGDNPVLMYYGNADRWVIGKRTGTDTGLQSTGISTWSNVLTASSTDAAVTNKTFTSSSIWNGNVIVTTYGGTGLASFTAGDLMYYASGTAFTKLGIGTVGQILSSTGSAPQWVSSAPTRSEYTAPGGGIPQETAVTVTNYGVTAAQAPKLLVFVDGQLMRQDTGTQGTTKDRDYWCDTATTIKFNFDIAAGGIVQWILLV